MSVRDLYIGIDPGTNTGFAMWNAKDQKFESVGSLPIHKALIKVWENRHRIIQIVIERPPTSWVGARSQFRAQGAGSVKRDFSIWEDYLDDYKIPYVRTQPGKYTLRKTTSQFFKDQTGWTAPTNEHGRDAAFLVFQQKL